MPTLSKISDKVTTASYRRSKNGESKLIQEECTLHWLITLYKDILPEKLHRQPGIIRLQSNQLQVFIDFLISCKILKNNPIDDLRAMRTSSKIWAEILKKQIRTSQYDKIQDELDNITNPSEIKIFLGLTKKGISHARFDC